MKQRKARCALQEMRTELEGMGVRQLGSTGLGVSMPWPSGQRAYISWRSGHQEMPWMVILARPEDVRIEAPVYASTLAECLAWLAQEADS